MTGVFLGLGSNLNDPIQQLKAGIHGLAENHGIRVIRYSSLYRGPAQGGPPQPDFYNAAVEIHTDLSARELLEAARALEHAAGRVRTVPNAPRALDIDVLLYGNDIIQEPDLTIPHPRLLERAFVLGPLAEIAAQVVHPLAKLTILAALQKLHDIPIQRVASGLWNT
jgi:2-amino-4-hydroxy-6-hydroxymethyldihydropteridine diphosphokinase